MLDEFKKFAMRGSVVDLAVGVIIGASFTGIVTSLVNDIIMPPIGWLMGGLDFTNLFAVLKGPHAETLAAAKAAGAVTVNYGLFINAVINFTIVALILFLIVRSINRLKAPPPESAPIEPAEDIKLLREIRDALKTRA